MAIDKLIGKNLRRIREGHGMSQPKLADLIGTTPQRLSAYETGREGMGKDYMERICRALHIEPWEFFVTETAPLVKDPQEQAALEMIRRAQPLNVAEEIVRYGTYLVQKAKQEHPGAMPSGKDGAPRGKRRAG